METSVDYDSAVSIRSTVVDILDEAFQHGDFSKGGFETVIASLATEKYAFPNDKEVALKIRTA